MKYRIICEINARFTKSSFRISDLNESLGICRSYFWEIFNREFGINPNRLIEFKRIVRALELIMVEQRLYDVARKSGFSNLRSFNRSFKRCFYISPSKLKKMLSHCTSQNRSKFCKSCTYKNRSN
jgi:AraC-like DNA-binding protein